MSDNTNTRKIKENCLGTFRIDLRSDIHTAPTPDMLRAMTTAQVGGDALADEDMAVCELEETCASLCAKEDALFVCSGTMGNIVSLMAISRPGCVVIADPYTHIVSSERRGFERLAGCVLLPVETDGVLTGDMVRECLRSNGGSGHASAVICVENTHGLRGGVPWGSDVTAGLVEVAQERRLRLHIDGARIFNAAVATGATVADLTKGADTVQVCLSKGLGAPIGSVIVGAADTIARAREIRQMLGGGMHKPGLIAAAGLVALRDWRSRLQEDHRRAKHLADLLSDRLDGTPLALRYPVRTNIVDLALDSTRLDGQAFVASAARRGLGVAGPWRNGKSEWIRLVTHCGIGDHDIEDAASILATIVADSGLERAQPARMPSPSGEVATDDTCRRK